MLDNTEYLEGGEDLVDQDILQKQQHKLNLQAQSEQERLLRSSLKSLVSVHQDAEAPPKDTQQPRRSLRVRTLTEKGEVLQNERLKILEQRFKVNFENWKTLIKGAKQLLTSHCSKDLLQDLITKVNKASQVVFRVYEDLRHSGVLDTDLRRKVDTCEAVTKTIVEAARCRLNRDEDIPGQSLEQIFSDHKSLLESVKSHQVKGYQRSVASVPSLSTSGATSQCSSTSSSKRQEAAAEVAASQATLKILQEQERQLEALRKLEAEDRTRMAEQEVAALKRRLEREQEEAKLQNKLENENAIRRKMLEDKRRELQRLETLKGLHAAKARMQVYEQDDSEDEMKELIRDCESVKEKLAYKKFPSQYSEHLECKPKANPSSEDSTVALIKALAESISASRLPIPEPAVFTGDPLKYNDWKVSFQTLIERKNMPDTEKIYYLRKYVGGPARKAIESYFLLGTEVAYHAAWDVLEERYGNPLLIAKSFRDKLNEWPRIGPKNCLELREFVDFLRSCEAAMLQIKGLQVLNDCIENQRILAKLPDWLTSRWNRRVMEIEEETGVFPSFSQFVKFLTRESKIACNPVTSLYALKPIECEKAKSPKTQSTGAKVLTVNSGEETAVTSCDYCEKKGHSLHKCRRFLEKAISERHNFVQRKKLCFGCLNPGHRSKDCESRNTCERCQKAHPTCLHEERSKEERKSIKMTAPKEREPLSTQDRVNLQYEATSNHVIQYNNSTHTSTIVPVWVSSVSEPDREVLLYALLDTQSDTTFILDDIAEALNTRKDSVYLRLSTMASRDKLITCQKLLGLQVRGFYSQERIPLPVTYTREFIPANKDHIPTPETARAWPHLEYLVDEIAPKQDCEVGLLIGYNCPRALLPRDVISGKENQPFAQRTDLGWSVVGCGNPSVDYGDAIGVSHQVIVRRVVPSHKPSSDLTSEVHYVCRTQIREVITEPDVIKALEADFNEQTMEIEHISQEDLKFLSIMKEGIRLKGNGHFEMPLPFKQERPHLPNNKACAVHRLKCLERKLKRNEQYYKDYTAFMEETISQGDAEKIPANEINNHPAWYIPHHGVYHPQKPGKIRVVFDCSVKFKETSLNDHLLTGPELTNTLVGVLCRFRKGPVAVMCDIQRMFHQFQVKREDRDYLRFLWWENGDLQSQPLVYRMRVHLFGAASSPGCSNYGLKHLAALGHGKFSESSIQFIQRNFYVDDGLASVSSEVEAIQLLKEAKDLCNTGKLKLHKFISNSKEVMLAIPAEERAEGAKDLDMALGERHLERALGVQWCVASDEFWFRIVVKKNPLTRRGVLSTVASVFDPLGFVAPFILLGKQLLQQMCCNKVGWDEPLPDALRPQWEIWLQDLNTLADVKIPRCYLSDHKGVQRYELHHFSDASLSGYGVCSYLRAVTASGEVQCSLVMGKARVAPTKITTIPRLELAAAVVAVRISDMLRRELEIKDIEEYFWTDSEVVLGYINNEARRFHVFVANRIQRIKQSTDSTQWRYVASECNPADHASRGLSVEQLIASNWFTGPDFLWQEPLPQTEDKVRDILDNDPECKKIQVCNIQTKEDKGRSILDCFQRFSDWTRVVKACARLRRFVKEFKNSLPRSTTLTSLEERREAEMTIIRMVQEAAFHKEIQNLKQNKEVKSKESTNKLHQLNPFLDDQGVLRVGGRLVHATLDWNVKHPAILPRDSHLSALLIKHHHEKVHHQGRGMTINELRSSGIWIIGCGKAVSSLIYKCVRCRKLRRQTEVQRMADLPEERVEATAPFTYCGMDCFGPFIVKEKRKELKRYGLLFTCMCSRAVHIEMLEDLTTDAFINALRTFIAIRGMVRQIRCDRGTNFVGARHELLNELRKMNSECLKELGCEFVFNTPSSSHMGGVWERQIRTIRSVLSSVLDQACGRLDCTSLRTYLYEVMAIVNSRPLSTENLNDPCGPEPLTPNHILTMKSTIISPPPGVFIKEDLYLHRRWRRVQFLANDFWVRWKKEYLLNLQPRQKWSKERRNARVNDIVILQDDTVSRNQWKLARVTEVYSGKDGRVRTLKLLVSDSALDNKGKRITKPTYLERPIHKTVTLLEAES